MRELTIAAMAVLAFTPQSHICAASNESSGESPRVVAAVLQPRDVEVSRTADPQTLLRLNDPSGGGALSSGSKVSMDLFGPSEDGLYSARVAIEFLEANTSLGLQVVDPDGSELNSVLISSPWPGHWSGTIWEASAGKRVRLEVSVKEGRALGTAYAVAREHITTIPILTAAYARSQLTRPRQSAPLGLWDTGTATYSPSESTVGTTVYFTVDEGPPSTCGDLITYRNGSWITSYAWLCTDATGHGARGPWEITGSFPGADQTDYSYVMWPGGSSTTWASSIIDVTPPVVEAPMFTWTLGFHDYYGGRVNDGWGSGFSRGTCDVWVMYTDETTGLCLDTATLSNTGRWLSCPRWWWVPTCVGTDLPVDDTRASSFRWATCTQDARTNCPSGHYCTATVKANDRWYTTTQTIPLQ